MAAEPGSLCVLPERVPEALGHTAGIRCVEELLEMEKKGHIICERYKQISQS